MKNNVDKTNQNGRTRVKSKIIFLISTTCTVVHLCTNTFELSWRTISFHDCYDCREPSSFLSGNLGKTWLEIRKSSREKLLLGAGILACDCDLLSYNLQPTMYVDTKDS